MSLPHPERDIRWMSISNPVRIGMSIGFSDPKWMSIGHSVLYGYMKRLRRVCLMTNQSEFKDTPSTKEKTFIGKGNKEIEISQD